jgi:hypothetical protein
LYMKQVYALLVACALAGATTWTRAAEAPDPVSYIEDIDAFAQLERTSTEDVRTVRNHLIPLGAIEKIRGVWAPRDSERHSGELQRFTWQVLDGFSSAEMMEALEQAVAADSRAALQFACEARGCGSSVQWANRIFQERLLYGTEKSQRYRVYVITTPGTSYRMLMYASARSSERQYLHAEILSSPSE